MDSITRSTTKWHGNILRYVIAQNRKDPTGLLLIAVLALAPIANLYLLVSSLILEVNHFRGLDVLYLLSLFTPEAAILAIFVTVRVLMKSRSSKAKKKRAGLLINQLTKSLFLVQVLLVPTFLFMYVKCNLHFYNFGYACTNSFHDKQLDCISALVKLVAGSPFYASTYFLLRSIYRYTLDQGCLSSTINIAVNLFVFFAILGTAFSMMVG